MAQDDVENGLPGREALESLDLTEGKKCIL